MSLISLLPHIPVAIFSLYFFIYIFTSTPFIPKHPSPHLSPPFSHFIFITLSLLAILLIPFFSNVGITINPILSALVSFNSIFTIIFAIRYSVYAHLAPRFIFGSRLKILLCMFWRPEVLASFFFLTISLSSTIVSNSNAWNSLSFYLYSTLSVIFFLLSIHALPNFQVGSSQLDQDQMQTVPARVSNTSALSLLIFEWVTNTVSTGRQRSLEEDDIPSLTERFTCNSSAHGRFKPFWQDELHGSRPFLLRALFRSFGARLLIGGSLKVVNDVLIFISPILLQVIITFIQEKEKGNAEFRNGFLLALCLFVTYLTQSLVFNQYFNIISTVQILVRGAVVNAVFEKSCKLSPESRGLYTSGQIQNLMSTDARILSDVVLYIHMIWSSVLQILVALTLLVRLLGWTPTMAGVMFMVSSMPIHSLIVVRIKRLREKASYRTDERVKATSEAIKGMKLVKLYAWELSFVKRILELRASELNFIRRMSITNSFSSVLVSSLPTMLTVIAFVAYAMTGATLNAAIVFPAIALFNVLRPPLLFLPYTIVNTARAAASLSRIQKFLIADELKPLNETEYAMNQEYLNTNNIDLGAVNAEFCWDRTIGMTSPTLTGVSFQIPQGSLVAIVGPTGGGKSTLLAGLLGELPIVSGKAGIRSGKTISYCDQIPFIRNETVRNNILFGNPFDAKLYEKVIDVCSLKTDLEILPAGDATEIGGRGVNLSGGQRSRISLARAVYSKADICILDDPLAAVDASVGKSIFLNCIASQLSDTTRLLTTNQLHYATSSVVDMIIVVKNGAVAEVGTRRELLANKNSELSHMVRESGDLGDDDADEGNATPDANSTESKSLSLDTEHLKANDDEDEIRGTISQSRNNLTTDTPLLQEKKNQYGATTTGKLTEKETKSEGRVRIKHYLAYLRGMGIYQWALPLFVFALGTQITNLSVNIWLSVWSEKSTAGGGSTGGVTTFLVTFVALGVLAIVLSAGSSFSLTFGAIRASVLLHEKLLLSVFGAPSSFFNSTPEGRLINRFNADIDKLDNMLADSLQSLLRLLLGLIATISLILWATPAFIFFVIPVTAMCVYIQEFYRKSSVDLRRLEALAKSPLYSHFGETLDGVMTIRAFRAVQRSTYTNDVYTDQLNRTSYAASCANRWISVRLEGLGTILIFGATSLAVLAPPGQLSASLSGLVLSYVMQILSSMTWTVRQFTEVESQLSAIERIDEYSEPPFPQEEQGGLDQLLKQRSSSSNLTTRNESFGLISGERVSQLNLGVQRRRSRWPKKGKITFDNVLMRYRRDLDPALRSVSFSIAPGEHVGIVGRTGAGKSSAIQSLFRLYELESGRISIDETNIAEMSLFDLRSSLGVIPQEPFCFSGTIRSNLDMFSERDDEEIQKALDACGLQDTMREKVTLDFEVSENGSNLSVGQRQLLCLGRALLKDSQLLVLDEATSNVSTETDERFQDTLRNEMEHCTILTVAHRLHTVIQYDRIIVMERGRIAEIGKPSELLSRKSMLGDLVDETGPTTASHLRYLANSPRGTKNGYANRRSYSKDGKCDMESISSLLCHEKHSNYRESLQDRVRHAFVIIRAALMEVDSPGWQEELAAANINESAWRTQLHQMVHKLNILSNNSSHIDPSLITTNIEAYVPELSSPRKSRTFSSS